MRKTFAIDYMCPVWDDASALAVDEVGAWPIIGGKEVMFRTVKPVTFIYNYPLSETAHRIHSVKDGLWTRNRIAKWIKSDYLWIYRNEDRFGVWGHGLGDLVIEACHYNPKKRELTFGIGS